MSKKNKTAADIYREEMSEVMLPEVVVEGSRPLDNIKITPEENLTDPYKDQFAVSLPKSNEIDYTQSNADRVIKDYQDAELARVVNSMKPEQKSAPVVDENAPIIDETLEYEAPTEEMKKFEEEKTQAQWQKDYLDSIWSKEDEEAAKKKQKAAQWVTAAQMLGDSIGALSNVYWTGKGANAMKFEPGAQKAATATYQLEKDIREAREKATKAQYDATLKKYQLEMDKAKADREKADADRRHEETVRHNKATEDISRLSAENAAKSANTAMYNAETSRMNAATASRNASVNEAEERRKAEQYNKQHGDRKFLIGDQWVNIPKDRWEGVVGSIYNSLPEEVRKVYETQVTDELGIRKETRKAPTIAVMDAAVRQYAQDPVVMDAILKAAGVKAEEVNPKEDEREKENTSTDSSEIPIQAYSAPADEWSSQWRRRAGLDTTDFSQFKRK